MSITKNDNAFCGAIQDIFLKMEAGQHYEKAKQAKVQLALQAFLNKPKKVKKAIQAMRAKQIQAVAVSGDFSVITSDSFNVTIESDNFDMGWEEAFKQVTLGDKQDNWEIYNVANSLTFRRVQEGQRLEVAGLTGTSVRATVDYYGGAIGWTDKMMRYRKVPAMVDLAETFRNKFWSNKAGNHYALLAAAAALNVTLAQGVANDGQLRRDVLTLNRAMFNLTNRNIDKGYGDMATAPILLYANPFDEDRIEAAFRVTTDALATVAGVTGIGQKIARRVVKRIYTYDSNIVSGAPILVLPQRKIQKADGMLPTIYNQEQDALTLNRVQALWAIYGAVVADDEQCETVTLA
jgi:hypothetical protein